MTRAVGLSTNLRHNPSLHQTAKTDKPCDEDSTNSRRVVENDADSETPS
jgi:hypothetical protein